MTAVRRAADALLELLFPTKCPFCRRVLGAGGTGPCAHCAGGLPRCGEEDRQTLADGTPCLSPLWYEGEVRESIRRYKFGRCPMYARSYGGLLDACLTAHPEVEWDTVTWAPLSPQRLRERGYDQARLLAEALLERREGEALLLLRKARHTRAQSSLDDDAGRRANVEGAYEVSDPAAIAGRRILLIDDVVTTGSTLAACAAALRDAGAAEVTALTLARAGRGRGEKRNI